MGWRDITGVDTGSRLAEYASTITRYDLLLGLIPTAFAVAGLVGHFLDLSAETTLLAGVSIAGIAVLDGLFFRPPTRPRGT
ncbi:hypothetical protein [Natrinema pallidum]|uniref:Uncharacterized protein n=2 Tax=Natrinema pallidum TaxID=69527 RepID=L9YSN4_9EURY|nr:hypothetical protein [Natrinema pallidum]ELY76472.1 hypothetical protein C487_11614 [Natrinema pallidum DSM 3751]QCW03101.1 hypothetical protein FGF80_07565 [Natrinema pallidum]